MALEGEYDAPETVSAEGTENTEASAENEDTDAEEAQADSGE